MNTTKSETANKLIEHIHKTEVNINGDPQKVAVFKFEEPTHETVKKVAGKFYKKDFTNPERRIFIDKDGKETDVYGNPVPFPRDGWYTEEQLVEAADTVGPNLILYNNYGRCYWDELKGAIRHAVLVEHVEDIIIDPVTRLTAGMSPSEANTELERFADEISKMAIDLQFTYYCFCHLKAPDKGTAHEFGGEIFSNQFTGSRAMMRACYYMVGLQGNKSYKEPLKVQNKRTLVVLDDRKYGRSGAVDLFYDRDTGDFVEPPEGFWEDDSVESLAQYYAKYPNGYKAAQEDEESEDELAEEDKPF